MEPTDISSYEKNNEQPWEPESLQQPVGRTIKSLVAAILLILAGVLGLFTWLTIITADSSVISAVIPPGSPLTIEQLQSALFVCGIVGSIFSIFAVLASIAILKRKVWAVAVIGSILGIFTVGPMFLGSGLSLIALILVILSKKEFQ